MITCCKFASEWSQSLSVSVPLICTEHQQDRIISMSACIVSELQIHSSRDFNNLKSVHMGVLLGRRQSIHRDGQPRPFPLLANMPKTARTSDTSLIKANLAKTQPSPDRRQKSFGPKFSRRAVFFLANPVIACELRPLWSGVPRCSRLAKTWAFETMVLSHE